MKQNQATLLLLLLLLDTIIRYFNDDGVTANVVENARQ